MIPTKRTHPTHPISTSGRRAPRRVAVALAAATVVAAGCTEQGATTTGADTATVDVTSSDGACELSTTEIESGNLVFDVTNDGAEVTEFYLLAEDGLRIVGEVEDIGPGVSRRLVVRAEPGEYVTACDPGMAGEGLRAGFTVVDGGDGSLEPAADDELLATAVEQYAAYVDHQTEQLVAETAEFASAYLDGDDETARARYPEARTHWERIEPGAESFGDLDPRLDLREADLEPGQAWTGWHRIEKDLWPPSDVGYEAATDAERAELADLLVADTDELAQRVGELELRPDQLGNGAKELLDEVATGKVTGEEEIWSGTDLWDFQANVDGARVAFEVLAPVLAERDPELAEVLEERFADVQALLDEHRDGDGFVAYGELSTDEVKALSDAVSALGEPLSRLTAAVLL